MAFPCVYICLVLIPRPASSIPPLPKQPPFLLSCHVYSFILSRSPPTFRPMWFFKCGTNPKTDAVRSLWDTADVWGDRHRAALGAVSHSRPGWPWTHTLLPQSLRCWAYKCAPLCSPFMSLSAYVHGGIYAVNQNFHVYYIITQIFLRNKKIYLKIKLVIYKNVGISHWDFFCCN